MTQKNDQSASTHVLDMFLMLTDMYFSMALQEVVHLGIADLLRDGPKPVHILAEQAEVQEDMLLLLMRILCSKDVFVETDAGIFAQTERSSYLQTDTPGSMASMAELIRAEWHRKLWTPEALTYALQTGKPASEYVLGENAWAYLAKHPEDYAVLGKALTSFSVVLNETIAQACDLTGLRSVVDIGGGEGSFLSTVLRQHPEMTGVLFDAPVVIENAQALLTDTELAGRWTCQAGDFLQSVPEGRDAYILKQVLHDWNDENCLRILRNCHQAIAPSGKLFIIEYILPEPPARPSPFLVLSLVIRQWAGGHQRTERQLRHLLDDAGFKFVDIVHTSSNDSVLEAKVRV